MVKVLKSIYRILGSYGLSCILFFFLLVLTLLGTLEQVDHGLYATQKKYFESLFLVHEFFGTVPVLLPGVRLLMGLLFVNLTIGALLRFRRGWSRTGVYIAHAGILLLLVGSFITYRYSLDGHMTLTERESSNTFESYHDWEVAIARHKSDGTATEYIIPVEGLDRLKPGEARAFGITDLPFDLELSGYAVNSRLERGSGEAGAKTVNGLQLRPMPPDKESEQNIAGVYARILDTASKQATDAILWGMARAPYSTQVAGTTYTIDLRKRRWPLPFTITLDKFTRELYPGTNMPKVFLSDVTKTDGNSRQKVKITMNEPLRYKGYTLYQSSWGSSGSGPNARLSSTFAVVRNPADQFPLYACLIITFGLLVHFLYRLVAYLKLEGQKAS